MKRKAKHIAIDVMHKKLEDTIRSPLVMRGTKTVRIKPYDLAIHLIVALDDAGLKIVYKKGEKP